MSIFTEMKQKLFGSSENVGNSAETKTPTEFSKNGNLPKDKDLMAHKDLNEHKVNLKKEVIRLQQEGSCNLIGHKARVFVIMDGSGSMKIIYRNGAVQDVLTRLLPLALEFDDNGELEVYIFNEKCIRLSSMTEHNYETYVEKEIMKKGYCPEGSTMYSTAVKKTTNDYNDKSSYPAFGIFITDGNNDTDDEKAADKAIRKSSKGKIFYQFIGIGRENFEYLEKLDNLKKRKVDNTAFFKVTEIAKLSDEQLYDKLLDQYSKWLQAMGIN